MGEESARIVGMAARNEAFRVVASAALALSFVLASVALASLSPWSLANTSNCQGLASNGVDVGALTPRSPVLLAKGQVYPADYGSIEFSLNSPADLKGTWVATSPVSVEVFDLILTCSENFGGPMPIGALNGTINITLFPGIYVVVLEWYGDHTDSGWTATQPIVATFDRGLDILAGPGSTSLPSLSYADWTISAPARASSYFLELEMTTDSCNDELAVLPASTFLAFESGRGPLNGNGTQEIQTSSTSPCSAAGLSTYVDVSGPLNWSAGDVLVYFNAGESTATLSLLQPLEVSYQVS